MFLLLSLTWIMNKTEHITIRLSASDYIRDYRNADRFIEYCKVCGNYGTAWVCPPYSFDSVSRIKDYKYVHIIGTKVFVDDATRRLPTNAGGQKDISYRIMEDARKSLDPRLLELERRYPGSLSFFAGSCFLCPKENCTRRTGKACLYPEKARSSLEAYGFDISRTASELLGIELKWSENLVLPQYFTLVSGLFTDHDIDRLEWI